MKLSAALPAVAVFSTGCDPVVNFYGSFFPAWVICLALGIFLAALLRWLFAVTRLERHLGPLALIYPALAFLLSAVAWLVLFGP
ncbi:MAG: YtcA family lipoprotein [Verrucomicrobiia bacterium]